MVEFVTMLLILATLASSSSSSVFASRDGDLAAAIDEMRSAGYFSFVMLLLAMSPPANLSRGNITFLLPDDETLSHNRLSSVHGISKFLLRHTIPSPLLFDYLQHIPTGSVLPTLEPEYMVGINNHGRTSYFLNNVRVSVPNVCVTGSSIRCHGIEGVLPASYVSPSTHCSNGSRGNPVEPKAQGLPSPPSPREPNLNAMPALSPSNRHTVSGSPPSSGRGVFRHMFALALAIAAVWSGGGLNSR